LLIAVAFAYTVPPKEGFTKEASPDFSRKTCFIFRLFHQPRRLLIHRPLTSYVLS
jgi:hypothetical protein